MSLMASAAEGKILLISLREREVEKARTGNRWYYRKTVNGEVGTSPSTPLGWDVKRGLRRNEATKGGYNTFAGPKESRLATRKEDAADCAINSVKF